MPATAERARTAEQKAAKVLTERKATNRIHKLEQSASKHMWKSNKEKVAALTCYKEISILCAKFEITREEKLPKKKLTKEEWDVIKQQRKKDKQEMRDNPREDYPDY